MSYISNHRPEDMANFVKELWPEWHQYCRDIEGRYYNTVTGGNDRLQISLKGPVPTDPTEARVFPTGKTVGSIYLSEQPACCGTAVSTYTNLTPELRGKGLGRTLLHIKEQLAMHMGYSAIQATIPWNEYGGTPKTAEIHILRSTPGWELDYTFVNKRTFHVISVFHKILWDRQNVLPRGGYPSVMTLAARDCQCSVCAHREEKLKARVALEAEVRTQEIVSNPIQPDGVLML